MTVSPARPRHPTAAARLEGGALSRGTEVPRPALRVRHALESRGCRTCRQRTASFALTDVDAVEVDP